MSPVWVSFVAACTALVAAVCSPMVALAAARYQFRSNVLSTSRRQWIETVRAMTAELIALAVAATAAKRRLGGAWDRGHALLAAEPALVEKYERLVNVRWNIQLLLNPGEADHARFIASIDRLLTHLKDAPADEPALLGLVNDVAEAAHAVIRDTWRRVKLGT